MGPIRGEYILGGRRGASTDAIVELFVLLLLLLWITGFLVPVVMTVTISNTTRVTTTTTFRVTTTTN